MPPFLIADDSPQKVAMLTAFLIHAHWKEEIVHAATTEDAMGLIDRHPDIRHAFIDYYMPSENGPAVIAYLKKKNTDARIALVSSSDKKENCDAARRAGAEICLCTSDPSEEFETGILNLLDEWGNN